MENQFLRGSEWRKWDLHIHPPGTKKNDQYRLTTGDVWAEFCQKIENSDVQAFGITDYFSADGYFDFIEKFRARYPHSRKVVFANVELCTNDVVNAASEEVNLHIVFNSDVPEQKIKSFLQNLETNKSDTNGRSIKASELASKSDFEEATTTRKAIDNALKNTFGDKADLTEYLLIFAAANNDGIRTETEKVDGKTRGKKRKAVITDELDKFSHGFFGNSNNTDYFLDKNRLETEDETIPKPVVSGCDAHSFSDMTDWLGKLVLREGQILKQPTWIKSDLTFEGLRQIIYEPAERVFIGEEPDVEIRMRNNQTKYLKSLYINHVEGYDGRHGSWFKQEKIDLNKELVAIIGNKGTGKSALTDIIGLLGNSHNQKYHRLSDKPEELFSFLNKDKFLKNRCAVNFVGELHWHAGEPNKRTLDGIVDENIPEKLEYLPQKYLEKICANIEDDEFRAKLNEVIFGYVEKKDRYDATGLEELMNYLTGQAEEDIKVTKGSLHKENEKVVSLERKLAPDYKTDIEEKVKIKEQEVDNHAQLRPAEVSKPVEGDEIAVRNTSEISSIESQIAALDATIKELESEHAGVAKQIEDLNHARQTIERHASALAGLKTQYQDLFDGAGIAFEDIVKLTVDYDQLDHIVKTKTARLTEIDGLLRNEDELDSLVLDGGQKEQALQKSLVYRCSQLEEQKRELVDRLDKPDREYQTYLGNVAQWQGRYKELTGDDDAPAIDTLNWLKRELNEIVNVYPTDLQTARGNREKISKDILTEKNGLVSFYNSVKKSIDNEIKKYRVDLGGYDVSIEASLRFDPIFYDEFFRYVNQGVKGSFHGSEDGKMLLRKLCDDTTDWQEEENAFGVIRNIVDNLDNDRREGLATGESKIRDIFKQMKQQKDPVLFYDYLFGFDYLKPKYDLKVDGKDLGELSPGERGALLLIFYLMLDKRDIPLVIDQPEDNLDNKSVYEILVTFLKKAKKRRQIIMVTHNPNLAVVADAEQIIHVSIDKRNRNDFDFYSGSIENPEINKRVVDILEGTLPAFDNRRLKYRRQAVR